MRRPGTALISALSLLLASADHLIAGNNAGGSAFLSWDRSGFITTLNTPPSNPFPLYLGIRNAPDIRALAVTLNWTPFDSLGQCYSLVPSLPDPTSGWGDPTPPTGDFGGDSSYTWTIVFPPTVPEKNSVAYWFSASTCDSFNFPPARFILASVKVMDAAGAIDNLINVGDAKLIGGTPDSIPGIIERPNTPPIGLPDPPSPPALPPPVKDLPTESSAALSVTSLPNPAYNSADLKLTAKNKTTVVLVIYDLGGRLVRHLVTEEVSGSRAYSWDLKDNTGSRVGSGLYYARAITPTGVDATRIVVVR